MSKHYWAILAVSLLYSPGCMVVQLGVTNPIPELSTVAVAPFLNLSQEPNQVVDGRRFALAYQAELQKVPGFEVIPVGVTEQMIIDLDLQLNDAGDLRKLAKELNADIVVIGAISDYTPYYPPRLGMTVQWFASDVDYPLSNVPLDSQARGEIIKSDLLFRKELFKAKWLKRYHYAREAIRTRPLKKFHIEGVEHPVSIQPEEFREVPNLFRGQSPAYPLSSPRIQTGTNPSTGWKPNTGLELWPNSSGSRQVRQPVTIERPTPIPQSSRSYPDETRRFPFGYSEYRIDSHPEKRTTSFAKIQNPTTAASPSRFVIMQPRRPAESAPERSKKSQNLLVSQKQPIPALLEPTLPADASQQKASSSRLQQPPLPSEILLSTPNSNTVPPLMVPRVSPQTIPHVSPQKEEAKFKPLMTYTRMFDASDSDLLAEWRDYLELSGDTRYGTWATRLSWSENFIRFTARLMIREMLIVHGGEARRRIIFKFRKHR